MCVDTQQKRKQGNAQTQSSCALLSNTAVDASNAMKSKGRKNVVHSVLAQTEGLANRTSTQRNEQGAQWLKLEFIMNACRTSVAIA
jgi:hypothetical protein